MSKVVQCELQNVVSEDYTRHLVTWLDAGRNLKRGDRITLKDMPDVWWDVINVGQEHDRKDIKRGWGMTDYFGKEEDRK